MASLNKVLFALACVVFCSITTLVATEVVLNTTEGMIYMNSFVAHDVFYSSLQELMRNKVKSAIEYIRAHSEVDVTQLLPNIDATEYTMLQILHSLVDNDLSFANQLVESLQYRSAEDLTMRFRARGISKLLKSKIVYSSSEMYTVAKSLISFERHRFKSIPKVIMEGIFSVMNKSELFTEASNRGDIDVMKWLLHSENDLDFATALDSACRQDRSDIIKLIIENDSSNRVRKINVTNCNKATLLDAAILTQSLDFLSLLIRAGVSVNSQDARGFSPLYLAVKSNNLAMSKLLIEEGANVNQETVDGHIALHEASRNGMVNIAELLLKSGSIADHKNKYGINPMMMLEKYVITNIIKYLINLKLNIPEDSCPIYSLYFLLPDRGEVDSSNRDKTKIDLNNIMRNSELFSRMKSKAAWDSCDVEGIKKTLFNLTMNNSIAPILESLINLGIRLDIESKATKDVFLNSIENGNEEMTILLINKGVSVNTTREGLSALHVALMHGRSKTFHLLVERGADVLAVRPNGRSALHSACEGQQKALVEYLIKRGLDVNATDTNSMTPLEVAASTGNYDIIVTLVKHGANVRYRSRTTPLLAATVSGNVKAVNFLLDNGGDIEEKANFEMTPLIAAVVKGDENMVKALLKRGASVHAKDDDKGDTALHIAARNGYNNLVEMLLKRGHEIEIKNGSGKTALDEAILRRNTLIINLLTRTWRQNDRSI